MPRGAPRTCSGQHLPFVRLRVDVGPLPSGAHNFTMMTPVKSFVLLAAAVVCVVSGAQQDTINGTTKLTAGAFDW